MAHEQFLVLSLALIGALLPASTGLPVFRMDQGNQTATKACTRPTVAIMISGQLQRFIYRDESGPLLATGPNPACAPVADVFIALSNATLTKPWGGRVTSTPYLAISSTDEIKKWYKKRGARNVVIKIVSEAELVHVEKKARKFVRSSRPHKLARRLDRMIRVGYTKWHWFANFRQYYMRHTVYALTLKRSYTARTLWRDDNFFLKPLDMAPMLPILHEQPNAVFVNKYCTFGSLSDKIYVLNSASARRVLSPTLSAFLKKTLAWVRNAYNRGHFVCPSRHGYVQCSPPYLQSETWLQTSLKQDQAHIIGWDFHRTEMRYMGSEFCASHQYYRCTPELPKLVQEGKFKEQAVGHQVMHCLNAHA